MLEGVKKILKSFKVIFLSMKNEIKIVVKKILNHPLKIFHSI